MSDRLPFFLHEALISLYFAGSDGNPLGNAIWSGAYANGLRFNHALEEVTLKGSGDLYGTTHHVDEENIISIERTWIVQKTDLVDFMPARNQQYVLQIVWQQGKYVLQRTFYGVTGRSLDQVSRGTNQLITEQIFRAQNFIDLQGTPGNPIVVPVPVTNLQTVGYFRESPLMQFTEYLLGQYSWTGPVTLQNATVIAWAPQVAPVVLTLEVNGVLTGLTLTIPVGAANVEVTAATNLGNLVVPANQLVRWLCTSAPAFANSAWSTAVMMQVQA
jgi:hypothetical protein